MILLAGEPGVGKTLTAESVAEKIHAPLYKLELSDAVDNDYDSSSSSSSSSSDSDRGEKATKAMVESAFDLAARWRAVLLLDECDMYLQKRSDTSTKRNRIVASMSDPSISYSPSLLRSQRADSRVRIPRAG